MHPASILNENLVWLSISLANEGNRVLTEAASVIGEEDLPDAIGPLRWFEAA